MEDAALSCDYLVVGAGAAGMAFTDSMLAESDATIVMVDRNHRPGGHWNNAYSFVRLHQSSSMYGVNSRPLGTGLISEVGLNTGLYELASGQEVLSHFDLAMQQTFLPSGRVSYFPMSEVTSDGSMTSLLSGRQRTIVARKVVLANHSDMSVPSTHVPAFTIAPGVACVPPNDLPQLAAHYRRFVVIGAGKTGMDTVLWLLENGASAESLSWIMPRDSWLFSRRFLQPQLECLEQATKGFADQMEALARGTSIDDVFLRLEAFGVAQRIDPSIQPTAFHCAVVSDHELAELRRIENIVRLGRLRSVDNRCLTFDQGTMLVAPDALFVDCSAIGIPPKPSTTIFQPDRLTLQWVRLCQPAFSASLIGHLEATRSGDDDKNRLCRPIEPPSSPGDWLTMSLVDLANSAAWDADDELGGWLCGCRLEGWAGHYSRLTGSETDVLADLDRYGRFAELAVSNIQKLLSERPAP